MITHSSILAWKIPWTEESGRLQSMGFRRVGYDLATEHRIAGRTEEHAVDWAFRNDSDHSRNDPLGEILLLPHRKMRIQEAAPGAIDFRNILPLLRSKDQEATTTKLFCKSHTSKAWIPRPLPLVPQEAGAWVLNASWEGQRQPTIPWPYLSAEAAQKYGILKSPFCNYNNWFRQ